MPMPEAFRRRPASAEAVPTRWPGISSFNGFLLKWRSGALVALEDCGMVSVNELVGDPAADLIKKAEPDSICLYPVPPPDGL